MQQRDPVVPNPTTILTEVPGNVTYFTVIDLANVFLSISVYIFPSTGLLLLLRQIDTPGLHCPKSADLPAVFSATVQKNSNSSNSHQDSAL